MPYSHHSHSGQFCKHASGKLEDVVQEAIRQGFQVYGLTEHVARHRQEDLYPEEHEAELTPSALSQQFDDFLTEAHRLKGLYKDQISLVVGLETEYITPLDLEQLELLLHADRSSSNRIEFIVGSVHHVNGIPIDFDQLTFDKALLSVQVDAQAANESTRIEAFIGAYLDAQYTVLTRFQPEIVGHIDLCRLYMPALQLCKYAGAWERLERNINYAVGYGALFELNAAAFRKGWKTAYPGKDVVQAIQKCGGRFTLSDDSHGPHAVGLNYDLLAQYLRDVGIKKLWYLEHSSHPNKAGRKVETVEADDDWSKHQFWAQRGMDGKVTDARRVGDDEKMGFC